MKMAFCFIEQHGVIKSEHVCQEESPCKWYGSGGRQAGALARKIMTIPFTGVRCSSTSSTCHAQRCSYHRTGREPINTILLLRLPRPHLQADRAPPRGLVRQPLPLDTPAVILSCDKDGIARTPCECGPDGPPCTFLHWPAATY